jgi:hypothetical protein
MSESQRLRLHCPLCPEEHTYPIVVERSIVMALQEGGPPEKREVSFVRFFTCPTKSEQFQATIALSETALNRVEKVTVGAPVGDRG